MEAFNSSLVNTNMVPEHDLLFAIDGNFSAINQTIAASQGVEITLPGIICAVALFFLIVITLMLLIALHFGLLPDLSSRQQEQVQLQLQQWLQRQQKSRRPVRRHQSTPFASPIAGRRQPRESVV